MRDSLIFDTSVWVDFLNKRETKESNLLLLYIEKNFHVFLTPTIVQELLQGIREDQTYFKIREILLEIPLLQLDPLIATLGAADLFRDLRKLGITIRKSNDCLIAFYALHFSIPIVHSDRDFDLIAGNTDLKVWK